MNYQKEKALGEVLFINEDWMGCQEKVKRLCISICVCVCSGGGGFRSFNKAAKNFSSPP